MGKKIEACRDERVFLTLFYDRGNFSLKNCISCQYFSGERKKIVTDLSDIKNFSDTSFI